jgi:hypothetical protein
MDASAPVTSFAAWWMIQRMAQIVEGISLRIPAGTAVTLSSGNTLSECFLFLS